MNSYDVIDDRKPDSHTHASITSSRLVDSVEFFFYQIDLSFGDTDTIVREDDGDIFFGSDISTSESSTHSCILDKVREYIVENLYEHIFIHTDEDIHFSFYYDFLLIFFELWNVLMYH